MLNPIVTVEHHDIMTGSMPHTPTARRQNTSAHEHDGHTLQEHETKHNENSPPCNAKTNHENHNTPDSPTPPVGTPYPGPLRHYKVLSVFVCTGLGISGGTEPENPVITPIRPSHRPHTAHQDNPHARTRLPVESGRNT